jgi:hypothetical protein
LANRAVCNEAAAEIESSVGRPAELRRTPDLNPAQIHSVNGDRPSERADPVSVISTAEKGLILVEEFHNQTNPINVADAGREIAHGPISIRDSGNTIVPNEGEATEVIEAQQAPAVTPMGENSGSQTYPCSAVLTQEDHVRPNEVADPKFPEERRPSWIDVTSVVIDEEIREPRPETVESGNDRFVDVTPVPTVQQCQSVDPNAPPPTEQFDRETEEAQPSEQHIDVDGRLDELGNDNFHHSTPDSPENDLRDAEDQETLVLEIDDVELMKRISDRNPALTEDSETARSVDTAPVRTEGSFDLGDSIGRTDAADERCTRVCGSEITDSTALEIARDSGLPDIIGAVDIARPPPSSTARLIDDTVESQANIPAVSVEQPQENDFPTSNFRRARETPPVSLVICESADIAGAAIGFAPLLLATREAPAIDPIVQGSRYQEPRVEKLDDGNIDQQLPDQSDSNSVERGHAQFRDGPTDDIEILGQHVLDPSAFQISEVNEFIPGSTSPAQEAERVLALGSELLESLPQLSTLPDNTAQDHAAFEVPEFSSEGKLVGVDPATPDESES